MWLDNTLGRKQPFIGLQSSEIVTISQFQFLIDFESSHILFYCKIECFKTDFKILNNSPSRGNIRNTGPRMAGSAELSRSLFVARSRDVIGMERDWCGAWWRGALSSRGVCLWHGVIGMRHWRDFRVNAQKWREKSSLFLRSTFRQMSQKKRTRSI